MEQEEELLPTQIPWAFRDESDEITQNILLGNKAYNFLAENRQIKPAFKQEILGSINELSEDEVVVKLAEQRVAAQEKLDGFQMLRSNMIDNGVDPNRIAIVDLGIAQQKEMARWLDHLHKTSCKKK